MGKMFPFCADPEISNAINPCPPVPTVSQGTSRSPLPPAEKTNREDVTTFNLPSTAAGEMRRPSKASEIRLGFS